jgi:hypothetical protein
MNRFTPRLGLAIIAGLFMSTAANAELFRAYLSSQGNDANPCTVQQPCRLLPAALTAVASGGEIWMLDSANYNTETVYINKSVTIQAIPGQMGSIVSRGTGAQAMMISMSGAKVTLRNLNISPIATQPGTDGVWIVNAGAVTIEDCVFSNLPGMAVKQIDANSASYVRNTVFRANGTAISAEGGKVTVASSQLFANTIGIDAYAFLSGQFSYVVVSDSIISGSIDKAVRALAEGSSTIVRVSFTRSTVQNSSFGVTADAYGGTTKVTFANSTVTGNVNAFAISTSTALSSIVSLGNNYIAYNGNDAAGLITTIPLR